MIFVLVAGQGQEALNTCCGEVKRHQGARLSDGPISRELGAHSGSHRLGRA